MKIAREKWASSGNVTGTGSSMPCMMGCPSALMKFNVSLRRALVARMNSTRNATRALRSTPASAAEKWYQRTPSRFNLPLSCVAASQSTATWMFMRPAYGNKSSIETYFSPPLARRIIQNCPGARAARPQIHRADIDV